MVSGSATAANALSSPDGCGTEAWVPEPKKDFNSFEVDLGCVVPVTSVSVRNSAGPRGDLGTKWWRTSFSVDHQSGFTLGDNWKLDDPRGKQCGDPAVRRRKNSCSIIHSKYLVSVSQTNSLRGRIFR